MAKLELGLVLVIQALFCFLMLYRISLSVEPHTHGAFVEVEDSDMPLGGRMGPCA